MIKNKLWVFVVWVYLLLYTNYSSAHDQITFDLGVKHAHISGFLQTPCGGQIGTASHERPTLDELSIKHLFVYAFGMGITLKDSHFGFNGNIIQKSNNLKVKKNFINHGLSFDRDEKIQNKIMLNWYQMYYLHKINTGSVPLQLEMGGGIDLFTFHGVIKGEHKSRNADRRYNKIGYQLAGKIRYPLSFVNLELTTFFPIKTGSAVRIFNTKLQGDWNVATNIDCYIELGLQKISFEDKQDLPNHIHASLMPTFGFGVKYRLPL